jgi:hypothetical protein
VAGSTLPIPALAGTPHAFLNRDINRLLRETSVTARDRLRTALNTAAAGSPPFGNNPAKIDRYQAFWDRSSVSRPLVGFSLVGWFPMREFQACRSWRRVDHLTPGMIDPQAFIEDHLTLLREGELVDDDLIRGACPAQVAIPWLPGIAGCRVRVFPDSILGEEQCLPLDQVLGLLFDRDNPWFQKYLEFGLALVAAADGRFPVSHSAEIGPCDLHALLRGHAQSIMDLVDEPDRAAAILFRLAELFCQAQQEFWKYMPLFYGGYFDAQYSLWSPRPIMRLQEDATAVYSPALYRKFVQPVDRELASRFPCSFMHLHSTSMFLLDAFLEIGEIQCFQINKDALGPSTAAMIPHYRKVQSAGKPLLIRGSFGVEETRLLLDSLDPRGLFLNIMVESLQAVESLRPLVGM